MRDKGEMQQVVSIWRGAVLAAAIGALLAGCSSMRESMGLTKKSPDEFAVVGNQPLILPPDFSLRPPRPGEKRPQEMDSQAQAIAALFPGHTTIPDKSAAERALLSRMGTDSANANIRSTVGDDTTLVADKGVFLKEILSTSDGVVDPTATSIEHVDSQPLSQPN